MDAIQFLKQEHVTAKAAFEKVLQAPPKKRGDLWDELSPELEAHEQIEDACLYEPLSREAGGKDPKLVGWRQKHQADLFVRQGRELDGKKREALVHQIQKRIQEQVVNIPIYDLAFIWGVGPRVEESGAGLIPGFAYSAPFEDLKLKK
jgi:Hemerythrin HHE cation binding domain